MFVVKQKLINLLPQRRCREHLTQTFDPKYDSYAEFFLQVWAGLVVQQIGVLLALVSQPKNALTLCVCVLCVFKIIHLLILLVLLIASAVNTVLYLYQLDYFRYVGVGLIPIAFKITVKKKLDSNFNPHTYTQKKSVNVVACFIYMILVWILEFVHFVQVPILCIQINVFLFDFIVHPIVEIASELLYLILLFSALLTMLYVIANIFCLSLHYTHCDYLVMVIGLFCSSVLWDAICPTLEYLFAHVVDIVSLVLFWVLFLGILILAVLCCWIMHIPSCPICLEYEPEVTQTSLSFSFGEFVHLLVSSLKEGQILTDDKNECLVNFVHSAKHSDGKPKAASSSAMQGDSEFKTSKIDQSRLPDTDPGKNEPLENVAHLQVTKGITSIHKWEAKSEKVNDLLGNFVDDDIQDINGIMAAAGDSIRDEFSSKYSQEDNKYVKRGVVMTSSGNLSQYKQILHIELFQEPAKFKTAVHTALRLADKIGMRSIAFPALECTPLNKQLVDSYLEVFYEFEREARPTSLHSIEVITKSEKDQDYHATKMSEMGETLNH